MKVEYCVSVKSYLSCVVYKKLDRGFVIEDHLSLFSILVVSGPTQFEQSLGFQERIRVAFKATGIPGKIDEQSVENLSSIGARWHWLR